MFSLLFYKTLSIYSASVFVILLETGAHMLMKDKISANIRLLLPNKRGGRLLIFRFFPTPSPGAY